MKTILLIFALAIACSIRAQSLKDALFSGKLKTDTGAVLKKGDSLQLRKEPLQKPKDSIGKKAIADNSIKISSSNSTSTTTETAKDNNTVWKQFINEYDSIFKSDVLTSKKIKEGTYSLYIDYAIETDGSVSTANIICVPDNSYLVEQVKVRMMANAPQLTPVLMSNGKPRKALKKQVLTFTKGKE